MIPLDDVEKQYKRMSPKDLESLAAKPEDLREDVLSLLIKELLDRGMNDEASNVEKFRLSPPDNSLTVYLEEKRKAKRNIWAGVIIFLIGLFLLILDFNSEIVIISFTMHIALMALGLISLIFGINKLQKADKKEA